MFVALLIMKRITFLLKLVICGLLLSGTGGHRLMAQRFLWTAAGGEVGNDAATSVVKGADGSVYVCGNIAGRANFGSLSIQGKGLFDAFVARYSAEGDVLWVKTFGGPGNDKANAITCSGNRIYFSGYYEDSAVFGGSQLRSAGRSDLFAACLDESGQLLWVNQAGGPGADIAYGIAADSAGRSFLTGSYEGFLAAGEDTLRTNNLLSESFVLAIDQQGEFLWRKSFAGTFTNEGTGITASPDGRIGLCGYFSGSLRYDNRGLNTPNQSYDIFLLSADAASGNLNWLKQAGGNYEDAAYAVASAPDGDFLLTGYFAGTAYFDQLSATYNNYNDMFIARYDAQGNCLWVRSAGGSGLDLGTSVCSDEEGNAYVTGMFDNSISFRGYVLQGIDRDVYMASYGIQGNLRWADKASGIQTECGMGIACTEGKVAVAGYYLFNAEFPPFTLPIADNNDLFVAQYEPTELILGTDDLSLDQSQAGVYPQPFNDRFYIDSQEANELNWLDLSGRKIEVLKREGDGSFRPGSEYRGMTVAEILMKDGTRRLIPLLRH